MRRPIDEIYRLSPKEIAIAKICFFLGSEALKKSGVDIGSHPDSIKIYELVQSFSGKPSLLVQRAFGIRQITLQDIFHMPYTDFKQLIESIEDSGGLPTV